MTMLLLTILVVYVTMVYGPIAAWLVETVPDPHPLLGSVAALSHRQRLVRRLPAGDGLRHRGGNRQHLLGPLVSDRVAAMSFVVALIFLPETKDRDITKI